jgi:hypothetical protein
MSHALTCRHCAVTITGESEDDLVRRVQEHALTHDGGPELTPEHILARHRRLQSKDRNDPDARCY